MADVRSASDNEPTGSVKANDLQWRIPSGGSSFADRGRERASQIERRLLGLLLLLLQQGLQRNAGT